MRYEILKKKHAYALLPNLQLVLMKKARVVSRTTKAASAKAAPKVKGGLGYIALGFGLIVAVVAGIWYMNISETSPVSVTRKASIIMIAHNENAYLQRTFDSIMATTPLDQLLEVIFVDDESDPPASDVINGMNNPLIKIIRNEERQGLIRAKTQGARAASGDVLIYLDAHIRAYPGWFEPLMRHTGENYKRVAVPLIPVLNGTTWEQISNFVGVKLLFDWKMDFIWLQDEVPIDDWVPIMSGGLLAITKDWFFESGAYDEGMLMWGGENVEQSVRIWLCGGEIVVARDSRVGHMFREDSPYVMNTTQIHVNKARAIDVWFDDYKEYYYRANPFDKDRRASPESLASRFALKEQLGCKPFSFFIEKFKPLLIKHNLLSADVFNFQQKDSSLCLALRSDGYLVAAECNPFDESQVFIPEEFHRYRFGSQPNWCIQSSAKSSAVVAEQCSAHINEQLNWKFEKNRLTKSPRNGQKGDTKCIQTLVLGSPIVLGPCSEETAELVAKKHKPYNHEKYSGMA